jgi:hypothetical protein
MASMTSTVAPVDRLPRRGALPGIKEACRAASGEVSGGV